MHSQSRSKRTFAVERWVRQVGCAVLQHCQHLSSIEDILGDRLWNISLALCCIHIQADASGLSIRAPALEA